MPYPSFLLLLLSLVYPPAPTPMFQAQVVDANVAIGYGLALGDVDGDGKPDILLADKKQFVWYRNGDWKKFVLAENLTESDNVCIAARDITGDGKVEVAVGAQWNPGETSDTLKSGAVFYLERPQDPTQLWAARALHHEPTVHRMKWVKASGNMFHLVVVPLHGRGNKNGEGQGVRVIAYVPKFSSSSTISEWSYITIDNSMHLTHNFDVIKQGNRELLYIGGKEGIKGFSSDGYKWTRLPGNEFIHQGHSLGEVRAGATGSHNMVAAIEPMHGNELTVYMSRESKSPDVFLRPTLTRTVLTSSLNQGHALAVADLLKVGSDQIVVGWRDPDAQQKTGIKIFIPQDKQSLQWKDYWIDDNGMACEDLQVADLDGDGKKDIIAAGRSSHNLKIYWNKSF